MLALLLHDHGSTGWIKLKSRVIGNKPYTQVHIWTNNLAYGCECQEMITIVVIKNIYDLKK
jgi:hypothetical protein